MKTPIPIYFEGRVKLRFEDNIKMVIDAIGCRNVAELMWSSAL
jgi:hypothetical protein